MASPPQKKARTSSDKVDPNREASELEVEVQQLKLTDLPTGLLVANIFPCLKSRSDWNSFSVVNRDIHDGVESHDALIPPWPENFKMLGPQVDAYLVYLVDPMWSPDGRNIACHDWFDIYIFDQCKGRVNTLEAHDCMVASYSPDGRLLVSAGSEGHVKIWDCSKEYECIQDWQVGDEDDLKIYKVVFSPDSKLVAVLTCERISLLRVEDGSVVKSFALEMEWVSNGMFFSPDGHSVIFGGYDNGLHDGVIKVWRIDRASDALISVNAADGVAWCDRCDLALSADGSNIASACNDGNVKLWKLTNGSLECIRTFEGRTFSCCSVSFTPDKIFLAVGCRDEDSNGGAKGSIRFLKLEDGTWSSVYHTSIDVVGLKCSPDGSRILVQETANNGTYIKPLSPVQNGRISSSSNEAAA